MLHRRLNEMMLVKSPRHRLDDLQMTRDKPCVEDIESGVGGHLSFPSELNIQGRKHMESKDPGSHVWIE